MASKENHKLVSSERAKVEALARKTEVLTESWQRERRVRLRGQLAVNAEIKQRWLEPNHSQAQQDRVAPGNAAAPRPFQPRGNAFKALLTAGKIPANNVLSYIVSALGIQRLATNRSHG